MGLLLLWAVLTLAGSVLIALPDTGPALVTMSGEHAPGLVDSAGALLVLAGFGVLLSVIVRRRQTVISYLSMRPGRLAAVTFLGGTGLGLTLAGVFTDFWWWWLIGALLMQACWLALWALASQGR